MVGINNAHGSVRYGVDCVRACVRACRWWPGKRMPRPLMHSCPTGPAATPPQQAGRTARRHDVRGRVGQRV